MKKQPATPISAAQAGRRMAGTAGDDRSPHTENASPLRRQVLVAARRRCDDMQDGAEAREQMQRDVLATPADLLPDLLVALSTVRTRRADFSLPTPTQPERSTP